MRKINTTDVFSAMRLVQKSGIKDKLVPVIEQIAKDGLSVEKAGISGILTVIEAFSEAKSEHLIYEWISGVFECKTDDVASWDLCTLADNLEALSRENDIRYFFTVLSRLNGKKH